MTIKPLYMALLAGAVGAALVPVVRRQVRNRRENRISKDGGYRTQAKSWDRNQATTAQRTPHAGAVGD